MNLEHALTVYRDDLISAAAHWQSSRSRRRRRLMLAAGAIAGSVVVVGVAAAAGGWLTGTPAPQSVKSDFGSYTPQLGFHPDPGASVLVASDGDYQLYATTDAKGSYCIVLSTPSSRPPESMGGGYCISRATADQPIVAGLFGSLLLGRVSVAGATAVQVQLPDGATRTIPLASSGFFLARIDAKPCEYGTWSPRFVALGSAGTAVAASTIMVEQSLRTNGMVPVACGAGVLASEKAWPVKLSP